MDSLVQDLRYAFRVLHKSPGFTAIALVTLALGIGANTAVFSVVNAVLLRPLPYPDAGRLMALYEKRPAENRVRNPISLPDFLDWQAGAKSFSAMALFEPETFSLTGDGDPERAPGGRVTPAFFDALGVHPYLGRFLQAGEERQAADAVGIVSFGMWQRRFGGDRAVLGKRIFVNGVPVQIVGVLPPDFRFPFSSACDLIVPIRITAEMQRWRAVHQFSGVARLAPGISAQQAQSEMALISARLEQEHPDENRGHASNVLPLTEEMTRELKPALMVLLGAVSLVMLIACANVANLLLARASVRRREMAVRAALGCSRWRLARQSLAESAVLALGGATLGVLLALWGLDLLRSAFFSRIEFFSMAGLHTLAVDWRVLGYTLLSAVSCALLFGISPALLNGGADLNDALRSAGRGSAPSGPGGDRGRFRSALIVTEVALSLVLLTGAGLLAKSFLALGRVNPGFRPERVLAAEITLPGTGYPGTAQAAQFYDLLIDRARGLPGVRAAAVTDTLPLNHDDNRAGIHIAGRPDRLGERLRLHPRLVSIGYLETMGIPVLSGRGLTPGDATGVKPVAILSETAAHRFWPEGNAVGQRFAFNMENSPWIEVVGIAAPVHNDSLGQPATEDVYLPYRDTPFAGPPLSATLVVRTDQSETALAPAVRAAISEMDRSLPVSALRPMHSYVDDSVAPERFNLVLLAVFAVLAVSLAAAGLYGVMAYLVSQRSGEIGIRMALGARGADVLRLVLRRGMVLTLAGIAIGAALSLGVARALRGLLFGVEPRYPVVLAAVALLLLAVSALACYLPARRASKLDPMAALRME